MNTSLKPKQLIVLISTIVITTLVVVYIGTQNAPTRKPINENYTFFTETIPFEEISMKTIRSRFGDPLWTDTNTTSTRYTYETGEFTEPYEVWTDASETITLIQLPLTNNIGPTYDELTSQSATAQRYEQFTNTHGMTEFFAFPDRGVVYLVARNTKQPYAMQLFPNMSLDEFNRLFRQHAEGDEHK